ncbi:hypothetical protein ACDH70_13415 [Xanthomonas axonopodis pv. poinsettiicola]|uniref:hypothetical protein n=1 Tax=Xanthomonas TaxID=338 RepID=UPI001E34C255|nr:hypothetical protein [Xanthomonas codiaei]MCC8535546.1 hypothetical protein [Xanthomonas codiaei]
MRPPVQLIAAIEGFDLWASPWAFLDTVRAAPPLDADDRRLLDALWSVACHAEHWTTTCTLQAGAAAAETALAQRYAWLSPLACRQLARAASYQWR